jgi:SOS-response transcriptional repressor LexA
LLFYKRKISNPFAAGPTQSIHIAMKSTWRARLQKVIDETPGLTMKALSLKAGLNSAGVHSILKKGHTPSIENFLAICTALGVEPAYLLQDEQSRVLSIPVVGMVSAGEGWVPIEDGGHDPVEFELGAHDTVALQVRGNSMAPVYRDGDTLICHRQFGPHADNLIGLDCVIRTTDGSHYVKILQRGSRAGRFNLRSYNSAENDIEDVALAWVAPVAWIKRGVR